ncbi:phosphate ABC transporter permease subunit PstC [uncultured Bartonella sp.]|uniref:phosphate ABC transporter permease subunit PstC n=1 Tax=uncultured Bartonella sp. TaxID=104108 RepID=UPI002616421E|nr:phosphate ABC transporter permease subunit PstC [uncultured Bartonella sp.]
MSLSLLVLVVFVVGVIGFVISCKRASSIAKTGKKMHSRPYYFGWWTFLITVVPSVLVLLVWQMGSAIYLEERASIKLNTMIENGEALNHSLALSTVESLTHAFSVGNSDMSIIDKQNASYSLTYPALREEMAKKGIMLPSEGADSLIPIAIEWYESSIKSHFVGSLIALIIALCGFAGGLSQIGERKRARNKVEKIVFASLFIASIVAILATIGIFFSLLFQTVSFFKVVPLSNFFFGTVWDPRFTATGSTGAVGQFGLLPLLSGTLYIAFVSMVFAVPVGLFAAIYMSEYASRRLRSIIKPLLEVLAGIPTIVYGFFALVTVGPFLRDLSIAIAGGQGFIMSQSVLTAGLVMGIMLIPFVSSLSDDIISAVPQSLRDGSYGLGATQSETIKKVVLPAALPGIVGAVLLTASRAIGETMIVVLAAGVAANLTINPFEAMTTITVKIVNQLTGDLEFNSPQTLVAFALGMTLFVLTLLMNVFALYVVRKYREQYE